MKPAPVLAALLALAPGPAAIADPVVALVNETGEDCVLISEMSYRIPGVLTATRSAREGTQGPGLAKRTDPARREALTLVVGRQDVVLLGLERPLQRRPRVTLHLLLPNQSFHQFLLELRLDNRQAPATLALVPMDDWFCPMEQHPYRLRASADGATVRIQRIPAGGEAKAEVKAEAKAAPKAEAKVEAKAQAGGGIEGVPDGDVPAIGPDAADGPRSPACAIL